MLDTEILQIKDLQFTYSKPETLIDGFSASLKRGQVLWVTGPPGSGKTTLLRLIIGELMPQSGAGTLLDYPLFSSKKADKRAILRQIGLLRETDYLVADQDLFTSIATPLEVKGAGRHRVSRRVHAALRQFGLMGRARCPISQLSSGEKRLVSLAAVLVKNPVLILADLNSGDVKSGVVLDQLLAAAGFGAAVMILSPKKVGPGEEYRLAGGVDVPNSNG